jgi:hypothetical protein
MRKTTADALSLIWVACRSAPCWWPSLLRLWCRRAVLGGVCLSRSPNARACPTRALSARATTSVQGRRRPLERSRLLLLSRADVRGWASEDAGVRGHMPQVLGCHTDPPPLKFSNREGQARFPGTSRRVQSSLRGQPWAAACWRRRSGSAEVVHASPGRGSIGPHSKGRPDPRHASRRTRRWRRDQLRMRFLRRQLRSSGRSSSFSTWRGVSPRAFGRRQRAPS